MKLCFLLIFILIFYGGLLGASALEGSTSSNSSWHQWKTGSARHDSFRGSSDCCSVIVNVNDTSAVFAYRRDSTYAATLNIQRNVWYGREILREYKTTNGYFFHTVIAEGGWMMGAGGPDIVWINRALERLGGEMMAKGRVTSCDMGRAHSLVRRAGMGHFVIRGSGGQTGVAIYRRGYSRLSTFRMKPGEFVSVPNSPGYYRRGYYSRWSTDPARAAVYAAGTDSWGVNRRNILTYEVHAGENSTSMKVYAGFDGGRLIGRYRGRPDNVVFLGKFIGASAIPRIPSMKLLGSVSLAVKTL
ncbi:hypothetical protein [Methanothermobacter wolfeii]|uniref:hypothetical protein n=1 Tax=Methanothermobacter wolfeii TaxID=145261 RepID=UPI0024B352B6|nr:hypothetical protein [Methanothermobacter wolfeii]MDI6702196.1 hypothetical protein [Methanothermobacter wolfeii]